MHSTNCRVFLLIIVIATTQFSGCGGTSGPQLITTKGTVTWNGLPLEDGRILFRMLEGDRKGFSAPIESGKFQIETLAGSMKVEITASRIIPGKFDNSNGTPEPVGEMYIPEKYNSRSELTCNVSEPTTEVHFALQE